MTIQPTFIARNHRCGSVTLICRETGERYNLGTDSHGRFVAYRNGEQFIYPRLTRNSALAAIESDARWTIRDAMSNHHRQFGS